jgi:hypothetical protein
MDWLAWIVLAALVTATAVWLVRRFIAENRRINGMVRDFDRENPRSEPGLAQRPRRFAGIRRRR